MKNVPFTPAGVYLLARIPAAYYEAKGDIVLNEATKISDRRAYIEKGDKMEVAVVGDDCRFVQPGDLVAINGRGMMELAIEGQPEPFILIRESEVLGKFG